MKLEDQIRRLIALKQTAPPPPTLLAKPRSGEDDLVGGGSSDRFCGVTVPPRYRILVQVTYVLMIEWMYCRPHPIPGGECDGLFVGPPLGDGSLPAHQWVTDRDKPLSWQRMHPDFNADDPATWGSLFGPGGFVEDRLRWSLAYADENGQYGRGPLLPGVTQADIDAQIDLIRQLYIAKCSFAVAQTGSCCTFPDFGGAECTQTTSSSCQGIYTAGGNCNGPNPCGLAPNLIEINDQVK